MGVEPVKDNDAWIEQVVKVAGALGFSEMRVRWKLLRWQEGRRKDARRREQWRDHVNYEHKLCGECGAIQDRAEAICTSCGAKLTSRRLQMLQRLGFVAPGLGTVSTLLALAILGIYVRVWVVSGGGLFAAPSWALFDFGIHSPGLTAEEPWRLAAAAFLHLGVLHLFFNVLALARLGPQVEELYGGLTMLAIFFVTATLANLGSDYMGITGAGASGGICGLLGAVAGAGQRQGTSAGHAARNDMLMWFLYTMSYGFVIGADNWCHAFGALLGALIGFALRPRTWQRPRLRAVRALIGVLALAATTATLAIIFTRVPHPPPPAPAPAELDHAGEVRAAFGTGEKVLLARFLQRA